MENNIVDNFYMKNLIEYRNYLTKVKENNHKKMANTLFKLESDMIWDVMNELSELCIPAYQVFDCIGVGYQHRDTVKEIMDKWLKIYSIPTYSKY